MPKIIQSSVGFRGNLLTSNTFLYTGSNNILECPGQSPGYNLIVNLYKDNDSWKRGLPTSDIWRSSPKIIVLNTAGKTQKAGPLL